MDEGVQNVHRLMLRGKLVEETVRSSYGVLGKLLLGIATISRVFRGVSEVCSGVGVRSGS